MLKLSLDQLRVGAPLPWDVVDASGRLLLRRGYVIQHDAQLESLLARGMYVNPDDFKAHQKAGSTAIPEQRFDPFWLWQDMNSKLTRLLRDSQNDPDFDSKVRKVAESVQTLIERNVEAALAAIVLLEKDNYAVIHSLHVAVVCEILGRSLEWNAERRKSTICAALTMNIAMLDLQNVVANQKTPLTAEQDAAIKAHPEEGVSRLQSLGITDPIWLKAVLEHHESPDGTGYPNGAKEMADESLLIRTADIFAAKVAGRANRKPMAMNAAAKMLFVHESQRQNRIVGLLIKELGIYPPGTIVFSLLNTQGLYMIEGVTRDTGREPFAIAQVVPREKFNIRLDLDKIWGHLSR